MADLNILAIRSIIDIYHGLRTSCKEDKQKFMLPFRYIHSYEKTPGTSFEIQKYFIFEEDNFSEGIMVKPQTFCI